MGLTRVTARRIVLGIVVGLLAAAVAVAVTQPRLATRVTALEVGIQQKIGVEVAAAGGFLEESGIPMPVPPEVGIGDLGQLGTANPLALGPTWLGRTLPSVV